MNQKLNTTRKQIILESAFESNVKFYVYLFFLMALCIPLIFILKFQGIIQIYGVGAFLVILFIAISIFYLKKGIVKDSNGLHIGYFSWSKLIYKDPISFGNLQVVTLLKFHKRSKAAYSAIANVEFSEAFNSFEIYLLSDKHTMKRKIIALKNENKANTTIDFLSKHSGLRHEVYSPDFS